MHGGTITSGRSCTFSVAGLYWMSCSSSLSWTTEPCETAMFLPTSKALSSVIEMRPFSMSPSRFFMPSCSDSPPDCSAALMASGFVSRKLDGEAASTYWRMKKRMRCLVAGSSLDCSTASIIAFDVSR